MSDPVALGVTKVIHGESDGVTPEEIRGLAERLFEAASEHRQVVLANSVDGTLSYVDTSDPSAFFELDAATGDLSFSKSLRSYYGAMDTVGLPSAQAAPEVALRHPRGLDLLPEDVSDMTLQHVGGLNMGQRNEGGSVQHFAKLVTVHFGRQIDGIPVTGSKIVVHLGRNGELVGLVRRWIEGVVETRGAADFADMETVLPRADEHLAGEWSRSERIESSVPEVAYYDDRHGTIEPAFVVVAKLFYAPQVTRWGTHEIEPTSYLGIIPALKSPLARYRQIEAAPRKPESPLTVGAPRNERDD